MRVSLGAGVFALVLFGVTFDVGSAFWRSSEQSAIAAEPQTQKMAPLVTARQLEQEIASRLTKVEEFKALRQICAELKVKCWLFGGTATSYAHYVKWDLLREGGDTRYQPDRFNYYYTNIYRSSQDADLVIDGTEEQAKKIETILRKRFEYFQGSKSIWEVRLLREKRGEKEALLNNPDFLNQHTDSNSTGMIEVTDPLPGESVVRDLRDWTPPKGKYPIFLEDVHQGKLHYYFSPLHATTSRAKAGLNPPILSAIRYLTKVFQNELEMRPEDWELILRVIREFDPARDLTTEYAKSWIERNGKKLIQNAVNIEYAWNKLEELGLRKKLIAMGNANQMDSLAWWMNREPLRSKPVGQGSGKTARELGISTVAHETKNFSTYESITRAHTGDPNLLCSRQGAPGEKASLGNGVYTVTGTKGGANTGFTIRFRVDPNAREGTDFKKTDDILVFQNKAAFRVIPESLNFTPIEFFRMLAEGVQLDPSNRAIVEQLKIRMSRHLKANQGELKELEQIVRAALNKGPLNSALFVQYLDLQSVGISPNPELVKSIWNWAINDPLKNTDLLHACHRLSPDLESAHEIWGKVIEALVSDNTLFRIKQAPTSLYVLLNKWKPDKNWLREKLLAELRSDFSGRRTSAFIIIKAIQFTDSIQSSAANTMPIVTPVIVDAVIEAMRDEKDTTLLAEFVAFLSKAQPDDLKTIPELFRLLEYPDVSIKKALAQALASKNLRGTIHAKPILDTIHWLEEQQRQNWKLQWGNLIEEFENLFKRFSPGDEEALEVLRQLAEDPHIDLQKHARRKHLVSFLEGSLDAVLKAALNTDNPKSMEILLQGLGSEDSKTRQISVNAIVQFKRQDPEVHLALARLIRDNRSNISILMAASDALYKIGPTDEQTILELLKGWQQKLHNMPNQSGSFEAHALWKSRHLLPAPLQRRLKRHEGSERWLHLPHPRDYFPELQAAIKYYETGIDPEFLTVGQCVQDFFNIFFR